jgi:RNA polymerase sigma-70 factor (ECF subfamily)
MPAHPRDDFADSETASDVYAALATLTPEQRSAIVLVDIEGYPVEEAAAILEVPTGTVKSRCARGRARLVPLLSHLRSASTSAGNPGSAARVQPDDPDTQGPDDRKELR